MASALGTLRFGVTKNEQLKVRMAFFAGVFIQWHNAKWVVKKKAVLYLTRNENETRALYSQNTAQSTRCQASREGKNVSDKRHVGKHRWCDLSSFTPMAERLVTA